MPFVLHTCAKDRARPIQFTKHPGYKALSGNNTLITCLVYVQIKTYASEQAQFAILVNETAKSWEIFHDIENLVPLT